MKHLHVAGILVNIQSLESLIELAQADGTNEQRHQDFTERLLALLGYCKLHDLELSAMAISPILEVLMNRQVESFVLYQDSLNEIKNRIIDELRLPRFFVIGRDKAKYFEERNSNDEVIPPFGEAVQDKFGRAAGRDIAEAGKCYAAGRNTACVFHLMRVIEVGLEDLQRRLRVKTKSPNWDVVIGALQKEADARVGKSPSWKAKHRFYSEALSQLRNIKDAWRNPVMHVVEWHDEDSAASIYIHTKALMQRLAGNKNPKKQ